jgi:hypothetical protein
VGNPAAYLLAVAGLAAMLGFVKRMYDMSAPMGPRNPMRVMEGLSPTGGSH